MADSGDQNIVPSPLRQRKTSIGNRDQFNQYFFQQCDQLLDQVSGLHEYSLVGGERQDAIEHVLGGITELSNYIADASDQISSYDKRVYSDGIKNLQERLRERQLSIAPNSKFQFKSRFRNEFATSPKGAEGSTSVEFQMEPIQGLRTPSPNEAFILSSTRSPDEKDSLSGIPAVSKNYNEEISEEAGGVRKPSFSEPTKIHLKDHENMHIIQPPPASRATSTGAITKLRGSVVDMSIPTTTKTPFASLVITDVKNCLIVGGQVAGATHITRALESIIAVSAGQVRLHDCEDVKIYLYCINRPIIENCNNIQFAPLPKCYLDPSQDLSANKWDQVEDFNWQKTEHSPNWRILPEEERLGERIWTNVVPGEIGDGLVDTKRKTGLK
ncbi:Tubulin-specific chaperone C [Erysiphe neolycopersici]|uniref:Tubulin-specific chaperone C n=1 Tax=Erysiphe neolycopersici TaxID=212602 RepID=A0A420I544_9PEZI|nr:Tubulin-specific chaperone C [Erysiphe neolycopersici]